MKKLVLVRTGLILSALLVPCAVSACSSSTNSAPAVASPSEVVSLDFSPSLLVVKKGDAKPIKVTATMGDGTKKDVTAEVQWESENPKTATVDSHGTIVGTGTGITTINATYKDATGSVKVTVAP